MKLCLHHQNDDYGRMFEQGMHMYVLKNLMLYYE